MVCESCEAGTHIFAGDLRLRERAHTRTHKRHSPACAHTRAGVSEACARQAKGRRGASNGFAALQSLAVSDDEDALGADEQGASETAAGQQKEEEERTPGTKGE